MNEKTSEMNNPYASRWTNFARGEDPGEQHMIMAEAKEAEAQEVEICGNCGKNAYYRPGVGAYQCPSCNCLLITRKIDGVWVDSWY